MNIKPFLFQDGIQFKYIDYWSSAFTWGGTKPVAGDFVVVPSDMELILNESPPPLKFILIQGNQITSILHTFLSFGV